MSRPATGRSMNRHWGCKSTCISESKLLLYSAELLIFVLKIVVYLKSFFFSFWHIFNNRHISHFFFLSSRFSCFLLLSYFCSLFSFKFLTVPKALSHLTPQYLLNTLPEDISRLFVSDQSRRAINFVHVPCERATFFKFRGEHPFRRKLSLRRWKIKFPSITPASLKGARGGHRTKEGLDAGAFGNRAERGTRGAR